MTYHQRVSLFIFIDSCIVFISVYCSHFLVNATTEVITFPIVLSGFFILVSYYFLSFYFHLYKKAWEYAGIDELFSILKVITFSIVISAAIQQIFLHETTFRLWVVTWLLNMSMIGGTRFCFRLYRNSIIKQLPNKKRTLIIGAGSAGMMVARQLLKNSETNLEPVAFIDDDVKKHHLDILGIPVIGGRARIEAAVKELKIDSIIISIPSLGKRELSPIFQECAKTNAKTQILPMLEDLLTGKVSVTHFRDVQVEDLLGREPVQLDLNSIAENLSGKVVLVTGAGGSIGSEICRQVSQFNPKQLVLLGHGENSIYSISRELTETFKDAGIQFTSVIADIQDGEKMMQVMEKYRPAVVYHAAAHKHVPLMEDNPEAAVKNNLIGTIHAAEAASLHHVESFVMISTDKAVNPTSVMGATKRLAEMFIQDLDQRSNTKFVTVRFGNVLGSRGSVIPIFKSQIEKGGPVTVTHPQMVRYFMTIPEASRLVLQAEALAKGGEIFVLDMGEPVKILDLAKNLINLSGHSVDEIGIEFTGMRPGEKLFEELLKEDEAGDRQVYPNIYIGKTSTLYLQEIEELINTYPSLENEQIRKMVLEIANRKAIAEPLLPSFI